MPDDVTLKLMVVEELKWEPSVKAAHIGVSVVEESRARRTVILSGAVKDFDEAFDVKLQRYKHPDGAYRGREGQIMLPDALKDVVQAVLGLDSRPQARANYR